MNTYDPENVRHLNAVPPGRYEMVRTDPRNICFRGTGRIVTVTGQLKRGGTLVEVIDSDKQVYWWFYTAWVVPASN